jgi:hypothetical protein
MSHNYPTPYEVISREKAAELVDNTGIDCPYLACAAAAISNLRRDAHEIFMDPTPAELDQMAMALEEYLREDADDESRTAEEIMADYKHWLNSP